MHHKSFSLTQDLNNSYSSRITNCPLQETSINTFSSHWAGKEMFHLSSTRKEMESKIRKIQNRINHLSFEQQRTEKNIEATKLKHESFSNLRDEVAQERIFKGELKLQREKEILKKKDKLKSERIALMNRIKENKEDKIRQNMILKKKVDEKNQVELEKRGKEEFEKVLKKRQVVGRVSECIKEIHHKRNSSFMSLRAMKKKEYSEKMRQQVLEQEQALKKINELQRVEENFMEKLQTTQKIQETINSILASPVHKDLSLLAFPL